MVVTSLSLSLFFASVTVVVMRVLSAKPSLASPDACVTTRSTQGCGFAAAGGACTGRLVHDACSGRSAYHPSVSTVAAFVSQAEASGWRVTTVVMCRASNPNNVFRSPVSVSVVVSVTTPPFGFASGLRMPLAET